MAIYLNVTQRSKFVRATCHVESVEHGGECRQRVCARGHHLTHNVYHDGACLAHCELHAAAAIATTKR